MENTKKITLRTKIARNSERLLISEVGEELVMMDLEGGNYLSLNKTGRTLWELLDGPLEVKLLLTKLMKRFNVSEKECEDDTLEYLETMYHQNLIILV